MRPLQGEQAERFLLRVEDARKRLGVGEETTLHSFGRFVPAEMQRELNLVQRVSTHMVGQGVITISWASVVRECLMARHGGVFGPLSGIAADPAVSVAPGQACAATASAVPGPAPTMPRAYPTHYHAAAASSWAGSPPPDTCFRVSEPCKLCTLLGRDNASTHEFGSCYANPRSHLCKARAYKSRMADLVWKGLEIPAYMLPGPGALPGDAPDLQAQAVTVRKPEPAPKLQASVTPG